jgi:acetyl/propionyl-CoA carboxylase alpha subunit
MPATPTHTVLFETNPQPRDVAIDGAGASSATAFVMLSPTEHLRIYEVEWEGALVPVLVESDGVDGVRISFRGYSFDARILSVQHHQLLAVLHESPAMRTRTVRVQTPMPGLLKSVLVREGATVRKGEALFTLEAMKMENAITAPINGMVRDLSALEGQAMEKGTRLCSIEPLATGL